MSRASQSQRRDAHRAATGAVGGLTSDLLKLHADLKAVDSVVKALHAISQHGCGGPGALGWSRAARCAFVRALVTKVQNRRTRPSAGGCENARNCLDVMSVAAGDGLARLRRRVRDVWRAWGPWVEVCDPRSQRCSRLLQPLKNRVNYG